MNQTSSPQIEEVVSTATFTFPVKPSAPDSHSPAVKRPSQSIQIDDEPPPETAPEVAVPTSKRVSFEAPAQPVRGKLSSEIDPNLTSVEPPSGFFFYPFKDLSLGVIKVKHQAKFDRANKEESTRLVVEAISSLLGDGLSAMDLTPQDFFWCMYWLRLNNFSRTPMNHRSVCRNPEHIKQVAAGQKTRDSLVTVDIINKTKIKEKFLDKAALNAFLSEADMTELNAAGFTLTAPRMRDLIELQETIVDLPDYKDLAYIADNASCLARLDGSQPAVSLKDRIDLLSEMSADTMKLISEFHTIANDYGVEESITTRCKDCNAVIETELSITAFDFL